MAAAAELGAETLLPDSEAGLMTETCGCSLLGPVISPTEPREQSSTSHEAALPSRQGNRPGSARSGQRTVSHTEGSQGAFVFVPPLFGHSKDEPDCKTGLQLVLAVL